jgi:mono/diheme cytochrome c family protein
MRFAPVVPFVSTIYMIALAGALHAGPVQDGPKTTSDGVYTDAQAKRGESVYSQSCASCHGPDLAGLDMAPSLTGAEFDTSWNDQPLDDLFERVRTTMPADGPGSLTREQYIDVVAFLLSKDGFPSGAVELPADNAVLKQVKFVAQKP